MDGASWGLAQGEEDNIQMSNDKGFYRCYVPKKFGKKRSALIGVANAIIVEYEKQGYALTLRQLYYQHVARGLIKNTPQSYDRLGALINDARLAGLISWTSIVDRGRNLKGINTLSGPAECVAKAREGFALDLWADQPVRAEVWVEKEALVDVVGRICNELRVDFFACKGYNSQSEQWAAGRRLAAYVTKGQRPVVFHLGDHDPSGIDMTRDNQERLSLFAGVDVQVVRLALNMNQVEKYNPPPNPAKMTDSRFADYERKFGNESWELDALDPRVIHNLIEDAILRVRNHDMWDAALKREAEDKMLLDEVVAEMG